MFKIMSVFLVLLFSTNNTLANTNTANTANTGYGFNETSINQLTTDNLKEYKKLVPLKMVGTAKFSVLFWDIYQSTLLSSTGDYPIENKQQQLLFEITYLKDISKNDLIDRTVEQWEHIGHTENDFGPFVSELENIWPNIIAGDSLALLVSDEGSTFYFNEQKIGVINNDNFGQLFLNIWLAHNTSQPQLRAQLLGKQSS